jgi:hypothetical protein
VTNGRHFDASKDRFRRNRVVPIQRRRRTAFHPSRPFATLAVEGRQSFAYSGRSLTRKSPAGTPNTPTRATSGSTPRRTSAVDQRPRRPPGR